MRNLMVPQSEWFDFFEDFSKRHEGWLMTVRVLHPSFGSQVEARDLPLGGVVSRADAKGPIALYLGAASDGSIEHEIFSPRQVWVEISDGCVEEAIGVLSEDGTKTIVEFRAPVSAPKIAAMTSHASSCAVPLKP